MKRRVATTIAVAMTGLCVMASAGQASGYQLMAITELQANAQGHFVTHASINGYDVAVLVDTGATVVALSFEDARGVGLRPGTLSFEVPVSTANGIAQAARVTIDRIVIDGVKVENVEGLVLPEGALRGTLLGMSFLSRLGSFRVEDGILYMKD